MSMDALKEAVVAGKQNDVKEMVPRMLADGADPRAILDEALIPAMGVVGERFKKNEIFVPEMLIAARAMKAGMDLIGPQLVAAGIRPEFTAVIGTVEGDLHDIGKNLVSIMWRGSGFEVVDLGANVSPAKFLEAVKEHKPHLIGLSALLTTTMPAMRETVKVLREAGHTDLVVLIGGAPVTDAFAREIGADGYAPDAASAVDLAKEVLSA